MGDESNEKSLFTDHYEQYYKEKPNKKPYSVKQLNDIANEISKAKTNTHKSRRDYYLLNTYDVVTANEKQYVIKKLQDERERLIYIIPAEDIYNRLKEIHINCGHGSRDKMINIIHQSCFIPRPCVEMFLKCCRTCQTKKSKTIAKVVVKPITSKNFMTRGQVDLIDFQSIADGEFKWLLNYQDHATKYLCLRPLKSKRATEVAEEIQKIFLQFGAPSVLQSNNGREFVNAVIEELKIIWPQLCIVRGRPRHPQSQGSVERANQDVENMLRAWMADNNSTAWGTGCYYVQWQKNNSLHRVIGRSPFKAVFGTDPKLGLQSTDLPSDIIGNLSTEEELEKALKELDSTQDKEISEDDKEVQNEKENVPQEDSKQTIENELDASLDATLNDSIIEEAVVEFENNNVTDNMQNPTIVNNSENLMDCNSEMCVSCQKNISNEENTCEICKMPLHSICATSNNVCTFCSSQITIQTHQDKCYIGQKRQAEQMIAITKKKLPNINIGDCVLVNVDKVDRSPGDPPNLISVITDIKNGVYQIGTKGGIIKSWFNRPDLKLATSNFMNLNQVNTSKFVSIREAVSFESLFKGQGYVKCSCQPSKVQCKNNRCQCFKAKLQCNSRCHKSGPCINK